MAQPRATAIKASSAKSVLDDPPFVSIEYAAELLSVEPQTVHYWITDRNNPMPAIVQKGRPPILYFPCVMLWLALQKAQGRRVWHGFR